MKHLTEVFSYIRKDKTLNTLCVSLYESSNKQLNGVLTIDNGQGLIFLRIDNTEGAFNLAKTLLDVSKVLTSVATENVLTYDKTLEKVS